MIALVINLDRSPKRLAAFAEQARAAGLDFERLRAVDGRRLSLAEQAQAVAPDFEFQPLNPCEIAIFMSQRAAWQRIVSSGQTYGAVFEDDVVLSPATGAVLQAIQALAPAADVIKLETSGRPVVLTAPGLPLPTGHTLRRPLWRHGPWIDLRRAWKKHQERRLRSRLARLPDHDLCSVPFDRSEPDASIRGTL